MCENILCGRFDPSKKFFTEKGSFWSNDTARLLATTSDADRQIRTRNRCNGEGYESVALLALHVGNNRLGLLQLNSKRKNMFSLEAIQMWERIADHLALALSKTLAEEKLREEDEKYSHLAEYAPAAIYEIDCKSLQFKSVNDYMCALSGYSEKELLSMSPFDLLNAESKERFREIFRKSITGEKIDPNVEFGVITKDGRSIWATLNAKLKYTNNELDCAFVVAHDITTRKKTEEALAESEANYRNLVNGMTETIWIIDFEGNFIDVNDAAVKTLGYSKEELMRIGVSGIDKIMSPEQIRKRLGEIPSVRNRVFETIHVTKDGQEIPVEISSSLITYGGKRAVLSIARNTTERKKAEQALIESEERLRTAFSTSLDAFMITTLRGSLIVECNDIFLEMFGYSRQEVIGKCALELNIWADPSDRERITLMLNKEGKVRNKESYFRRKNGEIFPVLFSVSLLETNNEELSLITARDISVDKKKEAALRESEAT